MISPAGFVIYSRFIMLVSDMSYLFFLIGGAEGQKPRTLQVTNESEPELGHFRLLGQYVPAATQRHVRPHKREHL
jgi:hypothetical protein